MTIHDLILKIDDEVEGVWFEKIEGYITLGTPPWPGEGPKGPIQYVAYTNTREGDDDPFEGTGWTPNEALYSLLKTLKELTP